MNTDWDSSSVSETGEIGEVDSSVVGEFWFSMNYRMEGKHTEALPSHIQK